MTARPEGPIVTGEGESLAFRVAEACRAARAAQAVWRLEPLARRGRHLARLATLVGGDADRLAGLIAEVSGRPLAEVWSAEVVPTVDALRWLAREGPGCLGERRLRRSWLQWYFRSTTHRLVWDPYGLVGIVTPGNAPLFLSLPQVAAALLAGNAVVWKPAPRGAQVAAAVADLFQRAGLAPALCPVVTGGGEAARTVVEAGVDKLFFTGGVEAGRVLYALQAARVRPAALELSGRHVAVVLADADLGLAAQGIAWGKLVNGGRNCISVQLVLVEPQAAPDLLLRLRDALGAARPGEVPPVRDEREAARLRALVTDAVDRGARCLLGSGAGPTLLADVRPTMRVVDQEVQGPILAVAAVASGEEAVRGINDSPYRLSASVWTRDLDRARALARQLDVGQVWINEQLQPTAQPEVTLAGRGASGFGASRGLAGLMEMVQPKVVSETRPGAPRRHYVSPPGLVALLRDTVRLGVARGARARAAALLGLGRALIAMARRA